MLYHIVSARLPIVYYIIVEIPTHVSLTRGGINIKKKNTLRARVWNVHIHIIRKGKKSMFQRPSSESLIIFVGIGSFVVYTLYVYYIPVRRPIYIYMRKSPTNLRRLSRREIISCRVHSTHLHNIIRVYVVAISGKL